jgi:RNA polymerase sigma-70 factor (ECF subfamily)
MEYYSRAIESRDPNHIFADEILTIVIDTLNSLPEMQREIFMKNRVDGLSYKETAELLGLTYKQVDKSIQNTVKKLRLALGEYLPFFLLFLNQIRQ